MNHSNIGKPLTSYSYRSLGALKHDFARQQTDRNFASPFGVADHCQPLTFVGVIWSRRSVDMPYETEAKPLATLKLSININFLTTSVFIVLSGLIMQHKQK